MMNPRAPQPQTTSQSISDKEREPAKKENHRHRRNAFLSPLLAIRICLVLTINCATSQVQPSEQTFSFAVLSDLQSGADSFKNALLEVRDGKVSPAFTPAELILIVGDLNPVKSCYEENLNVFADASPRPVFLPVIGNHEFDEGGSSFRYVRDVLISSVPRAVRRHPTSCDYYLDHKNVRMIAVDAYTDLGKHGVINDEGREWVEQVIKATPPSIEHIFISFHEPAFARGRHVGDSFDQDPEQRNAFWRMLLLYRDRVRAVFVGHTHVYSRMQVLDPAGLAANDPMAFPIEDGGIYQVNAATAGGANTIVQVQVEGKKLDFRVLQAKIGSNKPFAEVDKWSMVPHP